MTRKTKLIASIFIVLLIGLTLGMATQAFAVTQDWEATDFEDAFNQTQMIISIICSIVFLAISCFVSVRYIKQGQHAKSHFEMILRNPSVVQAHPNSASGVMPQTTIKKAGGFMGWGRWIALFACSILFISLSITLAAIILFVFLALHPNGIENFDVIPYSRVVIFTVGISLLIGIVAMYISRKYCMIWQEQVDRAFYWTTHASEFQNYPIENDIIPSSEIVKNIVLWSVLSFLNWFVAIFVLMSISIFDMMEVSTFGCYNEMAFVPLTCIIIFITWIVGSLAWWKFAKMRNEATEKIARTLR